VIRLVNISLNERPQAQNNASQRRYTSASKALQHSRSSS